MDMDVHGKEVVSYCMYRAQRLRRCEFFEILFTGPVSVGIHSYKATLYGYALDTVSMEVGEWNS